MSDAPKRTRIVSRGRLAGVLRQGPVGGGPGAGARPSWERSVVDDLDTQTFEALYYRARLILGEPLPRPGRFGLRGR